MNKTAKYYAEQLGFAAARIMLIFLILSASLDSVARVYYTAFNESTPVYLYQVKDLLDAPPHPADPFDHPIKISRQ
jgi:hypothetical protein